MKNKLNKLLTVGAMAGAMTLASQSAMAGILNGDDQMNAKQLATVKVSITDAITKAKAKQSGTVIGAELENEDGKFAYEVAIVDNGKEKEMLVDAITGEVTNGEDD
tara:strand:- start:70 stop:387 length:318 start_codon:yes stop_codon:yes gene_type:complete